MRPTHPRGAPPACPRGLPSQNVYVFIVTVLWTDPLMLDPAVVRNAEPSQEGLAEDALCPLHHRLVLWLSTVVPGLDLIEPDSAAPVLGLCFLPLRGSS